MLFSWDGRLEYMKNKSYALALIFFLLGVFVAVGFHSYQNYNAHSSAGLNNKSVNVLSPYLNTNESDPLDVRVSGLEEKSERIQYSIEEVNVKLGVILQSLDGDRTASVSHDNAQGSAAKVQSKEIVAYNKQKILNDASDTTRTLPNILNSSEMATLSSQDQQEILDELARRIDSGEIDKTKFLPGYRPMQ
jgi:hypothetical protein